jgi:enoyl-CoA hydratase/methylglutaconyl-CoA hydratase
VHGQRDDRRRQPELHLGQGERRVLVGDRDISGRDAAAYGLVTEAVPADVLDPRVEEVCGQLATGAPQGLRASKVILNRDLVARIDAHGEEMAALSARLFASDEARAAMTAFLKRKN